MESFPKIFDVLMDALLENQSVRIDYQKSDFHGKEVSTRVITPKRFILVERKKSRFHRICIDAYCHLRNEDRVFAVYRIQNITIV